MIILIVIIIVLEFILASKAVKSETTTKRVTLIIISFILLRVFGVIIESNPTSIAEKLQQRQVIEEKQQQYEELLSHFSFNTRMIEWQDGALNDVYCIFNEQPTEVYIREISAENITIAYISDYDLTEDGDTITIYINSKGKFAPKFIVNNGDGVTAVVLRTTGE